jgi:hypothetical protein
MEHSLVVAELLVLLEHPVQLELMEHPVQLELMEHPELLDLMEHSLVVVEQAE